MTAQLCGLAVALAREFVHAVGDGRVRRRLESFRSVLGICASPELLLIGFLLVSPLHLPAQPARRCPTRFGATLHVARCQCHRMRVFHPPRPLSAANKPRRRVGMETAMRHTKYFYRKKRSSRSAPSACLLLACARGGFCASSPRRSHHHPRMWRRHTHGHGHAGN